MIDVADASGERCDVTIHNMTRRETEKPTAEGLDGIGAVSLIDESEFFPVLDLGSIGLNDVRVRRSGRKPSSPYGCEVVSLEGPNGIGTVILTYDLESSPVIMRCLVCVESVFGSAASIHRHQQSPVVWNPYFVVPIR